MADEKRYIVAGDHVEPLTHECFASSPEEAMRKAKDYWRSSGWDRSRATSVTVYPPERHDRRCDAKPDGEVRCCARAGEHNGFGTDGPLLFECDQPGGCWCHD